ncbi:MAG: hypothetical protein AABW51_05110 [Nanoarchaeota archaeon]
MEYTLYFNTIQDGPDKGRVTYGTAPVGELFNPTVMKLAKEQGKLMKRFNISKLELKVDLKR